MIAGPFIRYSSIVNQIGKNNNLQTYSKYFSIGIFIFILGLSKKIFLADNAAIYSNDFFTQVLNGHSPAFTYSWIHACLFLFQLYFDFSAYSDMAIGLSLIFGIKLPINFDSPLKSTSIIEFWRRWHITLTNLIYEFIFIPLSLMLYKYFNINSLLKKILLEKFIPLVITFLIVGLWHGGTLNSIIFGLLNGLFIFINHQWRDFFGRKKYLFNNNFLLLFYWSLTFLTVVLCFVFFRAQNFYVAKEVIKGMFGFNGFGLPRLLVENISLFNNFLISKFLGINAKYDSLHELIVISACFLIIIFGKNLNFLSEGIDKKNFGDFTYYKIFFNCKKKFVVALAIIFIFLILNLNTTNNFIYFNF
jgi:D-alanyl-lipoteichoic acid acyltransferase DltB (MBOAT superfamily)